MSRPATAKRALKPTPHLELFDVQAGFGGATPGVADSVSVAECVAELRRVGVTGALVRTVPEALDSDVVAGNAAGAIAAKK